LHAADAGRLAAGDERDLYQDLTHLTLSIVTTRPERWANYLVDRLPRSAYPPFGGGPRACIGNAFAGLEVVLQRATLARQFQFEFRSEVPPEPGRWATLRADPYSRVVLRPRDTTHRVYPSHGRCHVALDGHAETDPGTHTASCAAYAREPAASNK
jgi:hypothetical protein